MDDAQARELEALEVIMSDPSAKPIKLSYGLLKFITENFSNEIGRGGFGVVYKGYLQNGVVAVKKISNLHKVSDKQFMDEIKCLQGANHKNIVRFLGYCAETQEEMLPLNGTFVMAGEPNRLLCFEYIPNGNIGEYLEQEKPDGNDQWHIRFKIIKGVCQGLHYLHEKRISHLDLKLENVMLDDCMEPKITDFGMSRFLDGGKSIVFTGNIRGTLGYLAPELISKGQISFKTDIYALGFIMIRLLVGRNTIDFDKWHESVDLDRPEVTSCIEIARNCTDADEDQRPTIGNIVRELDEIEIMLQELTNDITGSSMDQVFRGTGLLDVYPRNLSFPFKPNQQQQEMLCQVSLINKTDDLVGFFVLPPNLGDRIKISSLNGILTPMSTNVSTLKMMVSKIDDEPPLDTEGVLILMFTMRNSDDVKKMMKTSVDKEGELNMSTHDLEVQVQTMGGDIHQATLRVSIVNFISERATTMQRILVLADSNVSIWNWRTKEKMYTKQFHEGVVSAKFVARKHWLLVVVFIHPGTHCMYVYSCHTLNQVTEMIKFSLAGRFGIEVHPTRPFVLLYDVVSDNSMKILDWEQNWSCTQKVGVVNSVVTQVTFNHRDSSIFATLHQDKRVKIWKIDCSKPIMTTQQGLEWISRPDNVFRFTNPEGLVMVMSHRSPQEREMGCSGSIATLEGLEGIYRLENVFTYSVDQHLIAAITGPTVQICDLKKARRVHTLSTIHGGTRPDDKILAVACHRTHPILVTASDHGYICVWDSTTYRLKKEYMNLGQTPKDIAFVGSRRLMITYAHRIEMMDIDISLI